MNDQHKLTRVALVCCWALLATAGTALAEGFQATQPDACSVLRRSDLGPALGPGVHSHTNRFPLPELPAADQDINHFLTVSRTQCTWVALPKKPVAPAKIEAVTVNVLDRNESYSGGGKPWDASREALILTAIGTSSRPGSGGYKLKANDALAKKLHKPQLAGEDVFILADRKTNGERKAILGYRFDDGLWAYFGAATYKHDALDLLITATRHVVAG